MFSTKPLKFFLSLNDKTSLKTTKAALSVCLMLITFLQEVIQLYLLPPKHSKTEMSTL